MKIPRKHTKVMRLSARLLSVVILLFGLPFYFGYGNPLPFIDPAYTPWDNMWLTIFPLVFIGLGLGWKNEKIGGLLVTVPLLIGLLFGIVTRGEVIWFLLLPLTVGVLYFLNGYQQK